MMSLFEDISFPDNELSISVDIYEIALQGSISQKYYLYHKYREKNPDILYIKLENSLE